MKSPSPSASDAVSPLASHAGPGRAWLATSVVALLLAAGCVTDPDAGHPAGSAGGTLSETDAPPDITDERFTRYWLERAEEAHARQPDVVQHPFVPAPAVQEAGEYTRPSLKPPEPEREFPTTKVSLVMRDTDVIDVLQALARAADVNILVSPDVEGVTSVELRDVPWDEAFGGFLANLGLHHKWMGSVLRVMTAEALQKELEIEKLEKERELMRHERRKVEALLLQTVPIHYANATKLRPTLEDLLTSMDDYTNPGETRKAGRRRGTVAVDEDSNALVINALREDILKMIEVISILDQPKNQVLIEAKIIVATRETARELGFQWGGLYKGGGSYLFPGGNSSGILGGDANAAINPTSGNVLNFPSASSGGGSTSGGTGEGGTTPTTTGGGSGLNLGYAYQNLGSLILTAQLAALESAGKAQIIATPSITTLDNEVATLKSGFDIPYESSSEDGGTEVEFKEALLELTVTPHVIDGRMVKIKVIATNDEPDYSRVDAGVTQEPAISRRTAETSLLLFHGETTVIGGLSRTYGNDAVSGVPFLKDLPGIGKLFRSKATEKREEDMLIFITPYILGERKPVVAPTTSDEAPATTPDGEAPETKQP